MKKLKFVIFSILGTLALSTSVAAAHSSVSPSETFTAKNETYTVSVPTEKEVPTVGVRLVIPEGLERVTPFVKPGWRVSMKKNEAGAVTEITWTGGLIPAGLKDVFLFSGRAPQKPATLVWKVYQTYQGGEVVAWDRDPNAPKPGEERVANPYSVTTVMATSTTQTKTADDSTPLINLLTVTSLAALALSIVSTYIALTKKSV